MRGLGTGGVKEALPALGADQFDQKVPKEAKALANYFNFLLFSTSVGAAVGVTVVVWVSANKGWWWGFLICTVVTGIGYAVLAVGRPFYRIHIRIAQISTSHSDCSVFQKSHDESAREPQ